MVLTAMLLFLADAERKLVAACALARIDPDRSTLVLPTLRRENRMFSFL
jgi:hypothetical protein